MHPTATFCSALQCFPGPCEEKVSRYHGGMTTNVRAVAMIDTEEHLVILERALQLPFVPFMGLVVDLKPDEMMPGLKVSHVVYEVPTDTFECDFREFSDAVCAQFGYERLLRSLLQRGFRIVQEEHGGEHRALACVNFMAARTPASRN